ncbi:MAG: hypothetical protein ACD_68C00071G0002 [uncultured bacterium]|nr:MAG: hypothetical protein ACD_68C00071G0002 [uncultured bacterium]
MGAILAIDLGDKYWGLAKSDDDQKLAFPFATWNIAEIRQCKQSVSEKLSALCQSEQISELVIGLPLNLQGNDTNQTRRVRNLTDDIKKLLDMPVILFDERYTTKEAARFPGSDKAKINAQAAQIFLQSYLDSQQKNHV